MQWKGCANRVYTRVEVDNSVYTKQEIEPYVYTPAGASVTCHGRVVRIVYTVGSSAPAGLIFLTRGKYREVGSGGLRARMLGSRWRGSEPLF